ncbi:MAG: arsenite efflux transporter metallochaperone ArsD [Nitrospirae bacterium]|nr:arsenite efflux transporter metallochaperone ArsD [Nitrospirota bacterium]
MKIEIFDPAMCCSSGLCGPGVDPLLIKMNETVLALIKQGVEVQRYNLAQQPKEFMANKKVAELLHKKSKNVLPVTMVNGEVFKTGEYPCYEDICSKLGIKTFKNRPLTVIS